MSDHVYKHIVLTGSSADSIEDAVKKAISRASKTVRKMRWFEVMETRGVIQDDDVTCWQATIRVGFTLDE